jgi:GNAT superfamily N-acetyltransferase
VGTALVQAAEAWARYAGAARVHLTTATHRDGAHAFYRRLGYAATGTRFFRRLGQEPRE